MGFGKNNVDSDKLNFEEALDKVGFGLYGCSMTVLTSIILVGFGCIAYGGSIIVPTSACELQTTTGQQGLLATAPIISLLLGGVVWSYLADTRGRRAMLLISLSGAIIFNVISSISVNWIMLMVFQALAGIFAAGIYSVSMTLVSESVPMAYRNSVVLVASSVMILAQGFMAVLAIPIIPLGFSYYLPALGIFWNSWRTVMLVYCTPALISVIWLFFMQESPKFVYNKKSEKEALEILKAMHRINNWIGSKEEFEIKGVVMDEIAIPTEKSSAKDQLIPLFKAPLLKYTIIMLFMNVAQQLTAFAVWMPTIADQFVRIIQEGDSTDLTVCDIMDMTATVDPDATPCALDVTSLLIVLSVGGTQSLFNLIISFLINYVGRRNISIIVITICGVSGILINLVPNVIGSGLLFCIMLLGVVVVGLCTAICVALFPTNLRAMAIAFTMVAQYVGIVASVQLLNWLLTVNCAAGFYIFGSLFTSAAIAAFFLPDDRKLQTIDPKQPARDSQSQEDENSDKRL